jgi:hypothetical protein
MVKRADWAADDSASPSLTVKSSVTNEVDGVNPFDGVPILDTVMNPVTKLASEPENGSDPNPDVAVKSLLWVKQRVKKMCDAGKTCECL